jgi:hypothetical protein
VVNDFNLVFDRTDDITFAGGISGTGLLYTWGPARSR